jgi:hypothetical protein
VTIRSGTALGAVLGRAARGAAEERCELCSAAIPEHHRHLLDLTAEEPRCVCRACALLFERDAAGRGHYRLVPERRQRLDADDVLTGVPVGLAFFVRQLDGTVIARYPSPIGLTAWEADESTWQALTARWPQVAELEPAVEAVLLYTARGHREHWIVPIDDCYRLAAVIRRSWTGFSGGPEVWPAIDRFFAELPTAGRMRAATR